LVALLLAMAPAAEGQTRYIAFGDSITRGVGDQEGLEPDEMGYPPRLQVLLREGDPSAVVENHGLNGETTGEGLTRIDGVLAAGGDVLLLMEGTNDIGQEVSFETIRFNLQEIARKAADAGLDTVHSTIVPRLAGASRDRIQGTEDLAPEVRDLAWSTALRMADPFEVFSAWPGPLEELYAGIDRVHPGPAGYGLLAEVFADVLAGADTVPPVTGIISPTDDQKDVSPDARIQVVLYDFGAGIDLGSVQMLVNESEVDAKTEGDERRLALAYQPPEPLVGVVYLAVRAQDLADPANVLDRTLAQFTIEGTEFLDGDIDLDGRVDGVDLVLLGLRFGAQRGESRYQRSADFNNDGIIDGEDLAMLAANFGQSAF
jgi:lysophospholipase L1-like esterase